MARRYRRRASNGSIFHGSGPNSCHSQPSRNFLSNQGVPILIFNYFNWRRCRWAQPYRDVTTWYHWYVLLHARQSESQLVCKGNWWRVSWTTCFGQQKQRFSTEVFRFHFYMSVVLSNLEKAHAGPFMIPNPRLHLPTIPAAISALPSI